MTEQYDESKVDEDGVEYYAPDLGNSKPLKIHDNEEDVDDFETRLDQKVIFQRIAKELYKYPSSAVRELLVNAIGHGCRKANDKYGEDNKAYVDIHLHPHDRSLTITDVRGMGMTFAQIKSLMSYVGKSGNMDSKTAGQFGMGYFSHLKIADSCIVETRVREAYDYKGKKIHCMAFLNNRGWQWQKTNTSDEDVDLEEPGTRLSLTLNNDIDIYEVIRTIKEVSLYQDIMVKLTLDDDYGKMSAGDIYIPQIADLTTIHEEVEGQETIILDDDDVYFKAVMYKGEYGNYSTSGDKVILLARVPIEVDTGMVPNFSGYILNIKNERKYMPLPDRERLAVKSEEALKAKLEQLLKDHFGKLTATTPEELEAMPYQIPVLFMKQMGIARFFTQATKDFISSVVDHTISHVKYDSARHLTEYGADHNMHQVLAYRRNAFTVLNKALPPIRAVHEYCIANNLGTPQFLRINKKTGVVARELITQWNIPYIRDFMKAHKIKSTGNNSKSSEGLTFHINDDNGNKDTRKVTDFEDIDYQNTIWIKGPMKPWMAIINSGYTDFCVTKWHNRAVEYGIENEEPILTEATLYGMTDFEVLSSEGKQMFSAWYDRISKVSGYRAWEDANVRTIDDDDLEENHDQVMYTLKQLNKHIGDGKYVDNELIIQQKTLKVHDMNGNEIEVNLINNFEFLCEAYSLINNDTEVKESVDLVIGKHEIKIPYKATKANKFTSSQDLFGYNSIGYTTVITRGLDDKGTIQDSEPWRSYQLDLKDYFGIENKYHLKYDWREHFDLVLKAKNEIDKVFETDDIKNMMLKVTMNCDYEDYRDSLNKNDKSTVINTFYKNIKKMVPEPDAKDNLDVFFKTRHALNLIGDAHSEDVKKYGLSTYANEFARRLKDELKVINKRVQIKGNYEKFLNEFIPGCEAKVTEDASSINVTCNAHHFLRVKTMIELHSTNRILAEVKSEDNSRLGLRFVHPKDIESFTDVDTSRNYESMKQDCSCGCDNYVQNKLLKYNEDD